MKNDYNKFKKDRCLISETCSRFFPLDIDHALTQKAYPEFRNREWNCMTLCRRHHSERHRVGLITFSFTYPVVKNWLIINGFEMAMNKWIRIKR